MTTQIFSESNDWYINRWHSRAIWKSKLTLWPRRCAITNRLIWLRRGYYGEIFITGPGEPAVLKRWHDYREHLLWLLRE